MRRFALGRIQKTTELEGYIKGEGAALYYRARGTGRPLILLHGNGEDQGIFEPHVKRLQNRYRVVTVDTRGHGRSEAGTQYWNFPLLARDVVALMDSLSLEKAVIIGFSDGGNTAIQLAVDAPNRVAGIITVGANARPSGLKVGVRAQIMGTYALYTAAAPFSQAYRKKKRRYALMVREPRITTEDLGRITAPTLVISGDQDIITRAHSEELANTVKKGRLVYEEGADHFDFIRNPDPYLAHLQKFLTQIEYI